MTAQFVQATTTPSPCSIYGEGWGGVLPKELSKPGTGDWEDMMTERGFEQLQFYRESLQLLKAAYRLAVTFPDFERFNLSDQMRRAATSILLNIAEGYGRYHYLERLRFLFIARGSLNELLSAFVIAEQLGYCDSQQLEWVRNHKETIERQLNGYVRSVREQQTGKSEYGDSYLAELPAPYNFDMDHEINS
jgi:four helix bundle protein